LSTISQAKNKASAFAFFAHSAQRKWGLWGAAPQKIPPPLAGKVPPNGGGGGKLRRTSPKFNIHRCQKPPFPTPEIVYYLTIKKTTLPVDICMKILYNNIINALFYIREEDNHERSGHQC
jgi:hypothetical protein